MSTTNSLFSSLYNSISNPSSGMSVYSPISAQPASGENPLFPSINLGGSSPVSSNPFGMVPGSMGPNQGPFGLTSGGNAGFSANSSPYGAPASPTPLGTVTPPTPGGATRGTTGVSGTANEFGFPTSSYGQNKLLGSLNSTYGQGLGTAIYNFLASGAGYNQQAVNNLLASLQPGIERGTENLMEQFSATGNRFGSAAATGLGDYESQVTLDEGELETQMYEQSLSDYIDVLMGGGSASAQRKLQSGSGGLLGGLLGGIGAGASGIAAGLGAAGGGSGTGAAILAGLAAL